MGKENEKAQLLEQISAKLKTKPILILLCISLLFLSVKPVSGWSNGGWTTDINNPAYGTHDWIAQHALDNLPTTEKQYIVNNLNLYLYGTELPDNSNAILGDGIGDTSKHHVYYYSNGQLQDDASAKRANQTYQQALTYLEAKDYPDAAKTAGTMTHYIADVGVWAHVMGVNTDWGAEADNLHSDYESYVNTRTSTYTATYNSYLTFDGKLDFISAYNATLNLAYDTTFDNGGIYTCVWMNNSYSTTNPAYWNRAGDSLNLAVNAVTDVLHTLYVSSNPQSTPTPTPTSTPTPTLTPTLTPTPTNAPTQIPTTTTSPSQSASATPTPTTAPTQAPTATPYSSQNPTPTPKIPEFPSWIILLVFVVASLLSIIFIKRRIATK